MNHTTLIGEIQHQDLSLEEKNRILLDQHIQTDNELKELINQINDPDQHIEIPLQVKARVIRIEKVFVDLTKLIPKVIGSKIAFQALKETIPLKKEVIAVTKEAITTGGGIKTTGKDHQGKLGSS